MYLERLENMGTLLDVIIHTIASLPAQMLNILFSILGLFGGKF